MVCSLQKPIDCFIHEKFMYDQDEAKKGILPCKIIGASAFLGFPITFEVLVEDAYLYSDVPIHAFLHKKEISGVNLDFEDLSYMNVDSEVIETYKLNYLFDKNIKVYFRRKNLWISGEYLITLNLSEGNLNCHLLKLKNGQFSLSPNHKVNVSGKDFLPDYKKNHAVWSLKNK